MGARWVGGSTISVASTAASAAASDADANTTLMEEWHGPQTGTDALRCHRCRMQLKRRAEQTHYDATAAGCSSSGARRAASSPQRWA
jgi:hypothetical protein